MFKKIIERTSIRSYTDQKFSTLEKERIFDVINSSPTSINAHGFSAIWIEDQEILDEISVLNWNQKHIKNCAAFVLFVANLDNAKTSLEDYGNNLSDAMIEELKNVAIVDATISATMVQSYLLSINAGACFIGGVRTFPNELIKMLNLSKNQFPVVGLTVGYINNENPPRPKLNKVFIEKYDRRENSRRLEKYNLIMKSDYDIRNGKSNQVDWKSNTLNTYKAMNENELYVSIYEILNDLDLSN